MKRKGFLKIWSLALTVAMVFAGTNFSFAVPTGTTKNTITFSDNTSIAIPESLGTVKKSFTGTQDKTIVFIQDAHCNYEVQQNIKDLITRIDKSYPLRNIYVEGTSGKIDVSPFKVFKFKKMRAQILDDLMEEGLVTGPEYLAIQSDKDYSLFGVENPFRYKEDKALFINSYKLREKALSSLASLNIDLDALKIQLYSPKLKEFDSAVTGYRDKDLDTTEFCRILDEKLNELNITDSLPYPNFTLEIELSNLEDKIDYDVVNEKRNDLISQFNEILDKENLSLLVEKSLKFKLGELSSEDYYFYLKELAEKNNLWKSADNNLKQYIETLSIIKKISFDNLFREIDKITNLVKNNLFENDKQRTLDEDSNQVRFWKKLLSIKLTKTDYKKLIDEKTIGISSIIDFVKKNQLVEKDLSYINPDTFNEAASKAKEFYEVALSRESGIVQYLIETMDLDGEKNAVIVAGGFHTDGITELLKEKDISYLVIAPRITKRQKYNPYLDLLMGRKKIGIYTETLTTANTLALPPFAGNVQGVLEKYLGKATAALAAAFVAYLQGTDEARAALWTEVKAASAKPDLPDDPAEVLATIRSDIEPLVKALRDTDRSEAGIFKSADEIKVYFGYKPDADELPVALASRKGDETTYLEFADGKWQPVAALPSSFIPFSMEQIAGAFEVTAPGETPIDWDTLVTTAGSTEFELYTTNPSDDPVLNALAGAMRFMNDGSTLLPEDNEAATAARNQALDAEIANEPADAQRILARDLASDREDRGRGRVNDIFNRARAETANAKAQSRIVVKHVDNETLKQLFRSPTNYKIANIRVNRAMSPPVIIELPAPFIAFLAQQEDGEEILAYFIEAHELLEAAGRLEDIYPSLTHEMALAYMKTGALAQKYERFQELVQQFIGLVQNDLHDKVLSYTEAQATAKEKAQGEQRDTQVAVRDVKGELVALVTWENVPVLVEQRIVTLAKPATGDQAEVRLLPGKTLNIKFPKAVAIEQIVPNTIIPESSIELKWPKATAITSEPADIVRNPKDYLTSSDLIWAIEQGVIELVQSEGAEKPVLRYALGYSYERLQEELYSERDAALLALAAEGTYEVRQVLSFTETAQYGETSFLKPEVIRKGIEQGLITLHLDRDGSLVFETFSTDLDNEIDKNISLRTVVLRELPSRSSWDEDDGGTRVEVDAGHEIPAQILLTTVERGVKQGIIVLIDRILKFITGKHIVDITLPVTSGTVSSARERTGMTKFLVFDTDGVNYKLISSERIQKALDLGEESPITATRVNRDYLVIQLKEGKTFEDIPEVTEASAPAAPTPASKILRGPDMNHPTVEDMQRLKTALDEAGAERTDVTATLSPTIRAHVDSMRQPNVRQIFEDILIALLNNGQVVINAVSPAAEVLPKRATSFRIPGRNFETQGGTYSLSYIDDKGRIVVDLPQNYVDLLPHLGSDVLTAQIIHPVIEQFIYQQLALPKAERNIPNLLRSYIGRFFDDLNTAVKQDEPTTEPSETLRTRIHELAEYVELKTGEVRVGKETISSLDTAAYMLWNRDKYLETPNSRLLESATRRFIDLRVAQRMYISLVPGEELDFDAGLRQALGIELPKAFQSSPILESYAGERRNKHKVQPEPAKRLDVTTFTPTRVVPFVPIVNVDILTPEDKPMDESLKMLLESANLRKDILTPVLYSRKGQAGIEAFFDKYFDRDTMNRWEGQIHYFEEGAPVDYNRLITAAQMTFGDGFFQEVHTGALVPKDEVEGFRTNNIKTLGINAAAPETTTNDVLIGLKMLYETRETNVGEFYQELINLILRWVNAGIFEASEVQPVIEALRKGQPLAVVLTGLKFATYIQFESFIDDSWRLVGRAA